MTSAGYTANTKIAKSKYPIKTIKDEMEWKRVFYILKATYSALLVLRLTDSNMMGVDTLYNLIIINIFYFNCAFSKLICTNL
jgi:hypothetical protein